MTDTPRTYWNGNQLLDTIFPEPRWAVEGVLPEGLNVLAGSPKVGKSWLALGVSLAVAQGGHALGKVPVEQGEVLHLALEDTGRRLQGRLEKMLNGPADLGALHVHTNWPRGDDGDAAIHEWLSTRTRIRLVVVDVLARYREPAGDKTSAYQADYDALVGLKRVADTFGVCVLVVHHTRKAAADDYLDTVSGTQGIAGAADSVLVLRRARTAADATLGITGRDVDEAEHALKFDGEAGTWCLMDGPASDYALAETRRSVLAALREQEGLGPKAIGLATGIDYDTVKQTVRRMVADDQIDTDGQGHYFAPSIPSPLSPPSLLDPGDSDNSDGSDSFDGGAA